MNRNKYVFGLIFAAIVLGTTACKDQLSVGNPNAPTLAVNVTSETGLISLAQGGVYINGFLNGDGWLGNSYFSLPWGYIDLLGDVVGADASNNQVTTIAAPDWIKYDNGTQVPNTSPSIGIVRAYNNRASTGASNNALYYQWLNMYALNNACNVVLSKVDNIKFNGDATSRKNTIKAWCYFWKAYAYGSIGSMYYAGLFTDQIGSFPTNSAVNNNYVLHDAMINHSNAYYRLAASTLASITSQSDYTEVLGQLIPSFCQVGLGGVLSVTEWTKSINTMMARNILLNKLSPFVNGDMNAAITGASTGNMTSSDWDSVQLLTTNGIQKGDLVFTGRSAPANSFFSPTGGTVGSLSALPNISSTFKVSERIIQCFNPGDQRLANNFNDTTTYKNNFTYTTRYSLLDAGNSAFVPIPGVYTYASRTAGQYELFIAGSYEENALMLAEVNIRKGNVVSGLKLIDQVRANMGAGIAPDSTGVFTATQAMTELTKERRVGLLFRGVAFYDARRWGWTYDISKGGGVFGAVIVQSNGTVNTNATINFNLMDYWDVPADESDKGLNPSGSSVATVNPNFQTP